MPTQLRVRAVRVSPDGAVYIESSGVDLDLTQLPASAQTESKSSFEELDGLDPNGLDQSSPENATKSAALVGLASRRRRRLLRRGGQEGAQPLAGDWEADEASELPDGGDEDADGWFAARRRRLDQRRRRRLVDDSYRSDTGVWPYRIIGQLMYKVNTLAYICSGACGRKRMGGATDSHHKITRQAGRGAAAHDLTWRGHTRWSRVHASCVTVPFAPGLTQVFRRALGRQLAPCVLFPETLSLSRTCPHARAGVQARGFRPMTSSRRRTACSTSPAARHTETSHSQLPRSGAGLGQGG